MDDFTTVNAGAKGAQEFICGTDTSYSEEQSTRIISIVATSIAAISDDRVEVIVGVIGAPPGARVEAFRADGIWASIGSVVGAQLSNPDVPSSYLMDAERISLRIAGFPGTQVTYYVHPILTRLSSHKNNDGSISVTGSTTLRSGTVEALSNNLWKSIGDVRNGVFFNPAVPASYLYTADTFRVRVHSDDRSSLSNALDTTLGFPHSRSVLIQPMQDAAAEQAAMSWRHRMADYQPTGYFALGQLYTEVWVSGNTENVTLLVGTQGLADHNDPSKQSETMREYRLTRGMNIVLDRLGGAIHIRSLAGSKTGATRIVFSAETRPMPYFIDGETTTPQWTSMLRASNLPEVELVGKHVVIAALRGTALKFSNVPPSKVVWSHEEVMRLEAEVSGLDGSAPIHTRSRLLIYAVESRSTFSPHATSGYIGLPYSANISANNNALLGGLAPELWVTLHEYGHHYQTSFNSYGPFVEVTVNLYALAVGRHYVNEYTYEFPTRWASTQRWLALPRTAKTYGAPESDAQAMLEQLRKGLGEGFMPAWHRYIRENPSGNRDLEYFVLSASIAAKRNLTEFFADWGLLKVTDTEVWAAVKALGFPYPSQHLSAIRPYVN